MRRVSMFRRLGGAGIVTAAAVLVTAGCVPWPGHGHHHPHPTTTTTTAAPATTTTSTTTTSTTTTTTTTTTTSTTTTTTAPPVPCSPGSFSATGNQPCTLAPVGSYVATTGATSPTPCPTGQVTVGTGATSSTACETPSMELDGFAYGTRWGGILVSGLLPLEPAFLCADQLPTCVQRFTVNTDGGFGFAGLLSLTTECYTNVFFRSKTAAGVTIESNRVNAPSAGSCAPAP